MVGLTTFQSTFQDPRLQDGNVPYLGNQVLNGHHGQAGILSLLRREQDQAEASDRICPVVYVAWLTLQGFSADQHEEEFDRVKLGDPLVDISMPGSINHKKGIRRPGNVGGGVLIIQAKRRPGILESNENM